MAVRAASTYLRFNPKDTTMNENMKFYKTLPEITEEDSDTNLAPVMHHELYERGRRAYNEQKWQETVDIFEEALKEYLKAYKECQTLCDVRLESTQQYIPGGLYGYHVHLLLCRLDCPRKLSMIFNYPQPGHLSKYFDFLHYSYNRSKYQKKNPPILCISFLPSFLPSFCIFISLLIYLFVRLKTFILQ